MYVCPSGISKIVPIQLLQALLMPNLQVLPPNSTRLPMPVQLPILHHKKGIWLSDIQKWLPSQYSHEYSNSTVAKSDNASIPISLWNGRITSIYQQASPHTCSVLRTFIMTIYCRKLYKSLLTFLRSHKSYTGSNEHQGGKKTEANKYLITQGLKRKFVDTDRIQGPKRKVVKLIDDPSVLPLIIY